MILELDSFSSIPLNSIPFIPVIPQGIKASSISLRLDGEKWPTLRYFIDYNGHKIRIKEFFMDWFFTGFPKSLMSSFVNAYSDVSLSLANGMHIYSGRNYRNRDSASVYYHGTTVEAESLQSMNHGEFVALFTDSMAPLDEGFGYVNGLRFHERSFFASGHQGQWFEDQRIARLAWHHGTSQPLVLPDGETLDSSSFGIMGGKSGNHCIAVFQQNSFDGVIWLESVPAGSKIPHAYYELRNGHGIFNEFPDFSGSCHAMLMEPDGPQVAQFVHDGRIITAAFNSGIHYRMLSGIEELMRPLVNAADGFC